MDELERRRRLTAVGSTEDAAASATAESNLSERDEESAADDQAAARRDLDATIEDHQADLRDEVAEVRDAAARGRESHGVSNPDVAPQFSQRRKARSDREDAAADRARAGEDRDRARDDRQASRQNRERAAEDRGAARGAISQLRSLLDNAEESPDDLELVDDAQGLLMAAGGVGPFEALLELSARAARDETQLGTAARDVVRAGAQ